MVGQLSMDHVGKQRCQWSMEMGVETALRGVKARTMLWEMLGEVLALHSGLKLHVRCRDSPVSRCRIGSTDTGLYLSYVGLYLAY